MRPSNFPECGDVCFTPVELLPGVWHIRCNYGDLVFMTLLVGETGALLVDTGYGYGDLPGVVRSITELPLTVVCSHGHSDHNGGNFQFPRAWQSRLDLKVTDWSRLDEINENVLRMCPPPEAGGFDYEAFLRYDPADTLPLEDGQVFDLGGVTVQTVLVGNHTPGSCAFYVPERSLLVAGDAVGPAVALNTRFESCSVEAHIRKLHALEALSFDWILSGHSDRLLPRRELNSCIDVAEHLDEAFSGRYRSQLYPSYECRMYFYTNASGDTSVLILPKPEKKPPVQP